LHTARPSLVAATARGLLAGPLLFAVLISPALEARAEQSLVIHHVAHWLMVVAGAVMGYQLRQLRWLPGPTAVAWAGLGAALMWHLPPLLSWAEIHPVVHMFAHATLVAGGGAMGWAVPKLGAGGKAALFIAGTVVMWPLMLAELAGAFAYTGYPGQAASAGVAELVAMPVAWLVLAFWGPIHRIFSRPAAAVLAQALLAVVAVLGWTAPI
jgi:Protein of unknown function (DUF1404)